jgi:hypothetical protein
MYCFECGMSVLLSQTVFQGLFYTFVQTVKYFTLDGV